MLTQQSGQPFGMAGTGALEGEPVFRTIRPERSGCFDGTTDSAAGVEGVLEGEEIEDGEIAIAVEVGG